MELAMTFKAFFPNGSLPAGSGSSAHGQGRRFRAATY
jgi:hypothetical protein